MSTTAIKKCDCQHKAQDEMYGKGNRIHNQTKGTKGSNNWRCTVCKKEKP